MITRILRRTYSDNDLIFVRAAISTENIESDPPIYRSYYPGQRRAPRLLRPRLPRLRLGASPSPISSATSTGCSRLVGEPLDPPRAEPPDPGARLGLLPEQGRLRAREDRQRARRAAVRRSRPPRRRRAARRSTRSCSSRRRSTSSSRSRAPTSWSTWRCRRATSTSCRAMTPTRARADLYTMIGLGKQGKTLFYRDLLQHLHHSEDAFVEAPGVRGQVMLVFTLPVVPVRLQGDQGRLRPRQGHRPRDGALEVRDGQARRPRRAAWPTRSSSPTLALPLERFSAGAARRAARARAVDDRGGRRQPRSIKHCYVERRMTPLNIYLDRATPEEVEPAVLRVRQRDPRARGREHLPRRPALAELRRHPLRPRRLLRLRRDRVPDRLHVPPDPAAAEPGGRARRGAVVRASPATTSSRRSSRRSCSATCGCARRSSATTPICSSPSSGRSASAASRRGRSSTSSRTRSRSGSVTARPRRGRERGGARHACRAGVAHGRRGRCRAWRR